MKKKLRKGFSLVETILYMGLLGIFITIITQIFVSTIEVQLESESASSISQDGSYILSRFSYDLARADSITVPGSLGGQASSLELVIGGTTYTYSLSNGNLVLDDGTEDNNLNGYNSEASNLLFKKIGNTGGKDTVQMSFTLTSRVLRAATEREVKNFQITTGRR